MDASPDGPLLSMSELAPDSSPVGLPPSTQCDPEGEPIDAFGSEDRTASGLLAPENLHADPIQEARRSSVPSPFPQPGEHHAECLPHDEPNHLDLAPFLSPRPSFVFDQIRVRLGLASGPAEEFPRSASLDDLPLPTGCQAPLLDGATTNSAVSEPLRASSLEALSPSTEPLPDRSDRSTAHATEHVFAAVSPDRLLNGQSTMGQSEFAREYTPVMEGSNPPSDDRATPSMPPFAMNSPATLAALPAAEGEEPDSPWSRSSAEKGEPTLDYPTVPPQPNVGGLTSPDLIKVFDDHHPSHGPVVPTGAVGIDLRTSGEPPSPEPLPLHAIPGESGGKSSDLHSGVNEGTAISQAISARSPSPFEDPATQSHGSSMPSNSQDPQLTSSQETNLLQATNVEEITFSLDLNDIRTPSYDQLFQQERDFVDLVCRHLKIPLEDLSEHHYQEILEGFWIAQSLDTRLASADGLKFSVVQLMEIPVGGRTIDLPLTTTGEAFTGMPCVPSASLLGVRGSLEVTPDALVLRNAHGIQVAPVAEIKGFQVFSDRLAINFAPEKRPWFLGMMAPSRLVLIVWHLVRRRGS
ncbi:MAG: hypothetical protein OZSIB_1350 [Candidatus Ozemobacter sibiricus]|uniref:Uncharacterized protein n=1 Tax=Candidatus Ozemobacter sibiricus TaxID=2268124 RepID=A0A367ZKL1_9BACT|nr:MAG: hypothetical protein OZSIB_1350 [Candidatus Ozemobacter sibiricus]